jgi:putative hemolysin
MLAQLLLILLCLAGTAFFAGIETGVISIHRMRLRHLVEQGNRGARIVQQFLDQPDHLLGTTLVGTNLCMVVASVLATSLGFAVLGVTGEAVAAVAMTAFVLVFCEYLPKAWFQSQAVARTIPLAGLLRYASFALRPVYTVINWLTQWLIPRSITEQPPRPMFVTKDEIDLLAKEGEEHGALSPRQRIMIRRVFELSSKTARAIMTPRERMVTTETATAIPDFLGLTRQSGFTRLPAYDAERRIFAGIVNAFDVLSESSSRPDARLADFMRPPLFIPEATPVTEIFTRLRLSRQPMCLVTNAQAEVIGLVTTQDVLQEIVGKL